MKLSVDVGHNRRPANDQPSWGNNRNSSLYLRVKAIGWTEIDVSNPSKSCRPCSTIASLSHLSTWPARTCVYPAAVLTCKDSNAPPITALSSCVYRCSYSLEEGKNWMLWCKRRHSYCEREFPHTLRFAETKVRIADTKSWVGINGNNKYKRYRYWLAQLHCKNPYRQIAYLNSVVDTSTLNSEGPCFESWLKYSLYWITTPVVCFYRLQAIPECYQAVASSSSIFRTELSTSISDFKTKAY
jgi:hypothetical protein